MNRSATRYKPEAKPSLCRIEFRCGIGTQTTCRFFEPRPLLSDRCRWELKVGSNICTCRNAVHYAVRQAMQAAGSIMRAAAEKEQEVVQ
jgi:hypothetical protein